MKRPRFKAMPRKFLIGIVVALGSAGCPALAQQLPSLTAPSKGDTVNMSIQTGSRSSLSFGSSTTFGSSVSINSTEGTSTSATSALAPNSGASLRFSIGTGATPGTTSANIDNLRAQGSGGTTIAGSQIDSKDSTFSSGVAELKGVQSQLDLSLDSQRTGFSTRSNTLHTSYGTVAGQDGLQLGDGSQNASASGTATVNSNTNVDINSSNFTSVFMQAY